MLPRMDLSSLGVGSLGLWTRTQALALLTAGQVDHMVATRTWQVVWSGVYADGGCPLDAERAALAAVLASGGAGQPVPFGEPDATTGIRRQRLRAVACGRTAARVWGFPLIDDNDPATGACEWVIDDVAGWTSARDQCRGERRLVTHQPRFGAGDLVRRRSGLWLTSPLRTLVDCARLLSHEALVCALDDALHRGLVDEASLDAMVVRRRGLPGGPAFRRGVALADGRAEAPTETLARLILLPILPGLVPQVELFDPQMRLVARFDLGDEEVRLAVEADGKKGHAGTHMVAKDRKRDRRTAGFGWATERATWFEVRREQAQLQARVLAAHAAQRLGARRSTST
jgi:hypothetical protein